jgi:hypothetical protein
VTRRQPSDRAEGRVPGRASLPLAVLVQRKPGQTFADSGHLAGAVELNYIRTAHIIELDPWKLGTALEDTSVRIAEPPRQAFTQEADGGLFIDSATYNVLSVPPVGLPVITAISNPEAHLTGVGEGMAAHVRGSLQRVNPYGGAPSPNLSQRRAGKLPSVDYAEVVSDKTANGVRTVVGKVGVLVYSRERFHDLADHLTRAAGAVAGTYTGVGRVKAVKLGESAPITGESGYRTGLHVEALVTAESRTS